MQMNVFVCDIKLNTNEICSISFCEIKNDEDIKVYKRRKVLFRNYYFKTQIGKSRYKKSPYFSTLNIMQELEIVN